MNKMKIKFEMVNNFKQQRWAKFKSTFDDDDDGEKKKPNIHTHTQ